MRKLGLIGYPLGHSFSKKYYQDKFIKEYIAGIDYDLYPLPQIEDFSDIIQDPAFYGVNVTIPYKQSVIPFLDELSPEAESIGAVNCIRIEQKDAKPYLIGFNTDVLGFMNSLQPLLKSHHQKALIFGNGGATKAVCYALDQFGIAYQIVSRTKTADTINYDELTIDLIRENKLLINCSPVGTAPQVDACPNLPYEGITADHLLYDLIYNPAETLFLKKGKERGASIKNGLEMLVLQAEKNWEIWNL